MLLGQQAFTDVNASELRLPCILVLSTQDGEFHKSQKEGTVPRADAWVVAVVLVLIWVTVELPGVVVVTVAPGEAGVTGELPEPAGCTEGLVQAMPAAPASTDAPAGLMPSSWLSKAESWTSDIAEVLDSVNPTCNRHRVTR